MPEIAISNSKGRDASVVAESIRVPMRMWWIDVEDRRVVGEAVQQSSTP